MARSQSSNSTGLSFAEKTGIGVPAANPVWYELEPNSYDDFGAKITTVARAPITEGRQQKKGTVTDLDASGGFNQDFTQNALRKLLQGFLYADAREKATTQPLNGTAVALTGVSADGYAAAAGLGVFKPGHLVFASGFKNQANNGLSHVTAADADSVSVDRAGLTDEGVPPAAAKLQAVGYEFPAGDLSLAAGVGVAYLISAATDLSALGLLAGEWIVVGGDGGAMLPNNVPGYARIKAVSANQITLDKTSWTPVTTDGAGATVRIFFGTVLRNEPLPANIKRRTYDLERTLGQDDVGIQAEYLEDAFADSIKLNMGSATKLTADLAFVALDKASVTGANGLKAGTRVDAPFDDAYNTSSDLFRARMSLVDAATLNPTALFAYLTDTTLTIDNNVSAVKAMGYIGGFDAVEGDIVVSGSLTAYFSDVNAVDAVRNNADVTVDWIFAKKNYGFLVDLPLISLGNGLPAVTKDQKITIPLDMTAFESDTYGYTVLLNFFDYLPTVVMAS